LKRIDEYQIYHNRVVEEITELMGEDCRKFYDKECTYFDEFDQGIPPRQVAEEQLAAMRDLVNEADLRIECKPNPGRGKRTRRNLRVI
jgi:hypothetical protein